MYVCVCVMCVCACCVGGANQVGGGEATEAESLCSCRHYSGKKGNQKLNKFKLSFHFLGTAEN